MNGLIDEIFGVLTVVALEVAWAAGLIVAVYWLIT